MKPKIFITLLLMVSAICLVCVRRAQKDYPIKPVAFTEVKVNDTFWLPRMESHYVKCNI